jgi:hypothetical protein
MSVITWHDMDVFEAEAQAKVDEIYQEWVMEWAGSRLDILLMQAQAQMQQQGQMQGQQQGQMPGQGAANGLANG